MLLYISLLYTMKYLGGKQRLGKYISPVLLQIYEFYKNHLKGYLEPFCGSLGVLKNMTENNINKIEANDYHPDLIQLWKEVQSGSFIFPKSIFDDEYKVAILLETKCIQGVCYGMSFGGRFFGAYSQKYLNGKNEDFCKEMVNSLNRIAPKIKNVKFTNKDYLSLKPKNMLIYCDPPYEKTKFPIKYRRDVKKYDIFDNTKFWETVRNWSKNNIVIVSETDAPSDFVEIWKFERYRSAAQSNKTRFANDSSTHKVEKLFVHKSTKQLENILKCRFNNNYILLYRLLRYMNLMILSYTSHIVV